jgi:TonB-linked SusC/RagA family outer membrane protein
MRTRRSICTLWSSTQLGRRLDDDAASSTRQSSTPLTAEGNIVTQSLSHPARAVTRLVAMLVQSCALAAGLALIPLPLAAQDGRITGTVTGEAGQPLPNANVTIPATRLGAVTGDDGRYTITGVPAGTHQVRAQRIGYAPQTQPVTVAAGDVARGDFRLAPLPTSLSAQVVVGYTTQQRRDISDAVASTTGEELRDAKVATVEEALRGRLPGVQVAASGEPGRPAQVIIRGQAFVSGSISPLYVVDGMYMQQNPNINPDDIESIEVLKDASAAAQYGAQAANGVIVIRTKHGRPGANRIEVHSYYGYQDVPKRIDMMNTAEWAALTNQATQNSLDPNDVIPSAVTPPSTNTDWQDAVFGRGAITDHNLSVSGGTQTANYLISGGWLRQEGVILETNFERYSFRVNSEATRGRLTFGENVALSNARQRGLNGFPLIDVLRMPPTIPVLDPTTSSGFGIGSDATPTFGTNPVGAQERRDNLGRSNQVIGTGYAQVNLFSQLRYRFNLGVNYEDFRREDFVLRGILRFRGPLDPARLTNTQNTAQSLLFENLLTYENTFRTDHRLSAVAGITEQKQTRDTLVAYREGYTDEDLRTIDAGSTNNLNNHGGRVESALRAYLLRANYSFRDRYLLTGSVRRDGSSRFGPSNRYADFAAASVGWVMSEEPFYSSAPLLGSHVGYLKLRASYGVLGNQDIGDYRFAAPINQNLNYLFGNSIVTSGATQLSLANPNIKWQSNKQMNIGLDLGMLGDRLTATADFYRSTSDGLLVSAPIPWSLGADPNAIPVVNAGSIRNRGLELGLTHRLDRDRFQLNTSANLTTTKNKVLSLGNGGQPIFTRTVARTTVGRPIGEFYVLKTQGIFQSAADVLAHTTTLSNGTVKVIQPNAKPGDIRYADLNGDGVINADDRYAAGSGNPDFTYGMFFDGKFRQLDFGVGLRGSHGAEIFNVARYWTDRMDDLSNYRADLKPWTPTNPSNTTPRAVFGTEGADNAQFASDRWIEDGSFLRIQNVRLGYTLPETFSRLLGSPDAQPRIYVNIQNLYTFTDFSNWDPETLGFGDALARGIDDGTIYPNVRTVTFGLDLRF